MEKGITLSDSRSIVAMVLAIAAVLVGLTFFSSRQLAEGGTGFPTPRVAEGGIGFPTPRP